MGKRRGTMRAIQAGSTEAIGQPISLLTPFGIPGGPRRFHAHHDILSALSLWLGLNLVRSVASLSFSF